MRSGAPGENASQSEEKGNESRAGPTFSGPSALSEFRPSLQTTGLLPDCRH